MNYSALFRCFMALLLSFVGLSSSFSQPPCLKWSDSDCQLLPVVLRSDANADFFVAQDILEFTNNCQQTLTTEIGMVESNKFFSISKQTAPLEKGQLVFRDSLWYRPETMELRQATTTIKNSANQLYRVQYFYFFVGNGVTQVLDASGKIVRFEKDFGFRKLCLEVDENRIPTGYGYRSTKTEEKVGQWQMWASSTSYPTIEEHSKLFRVQLLNENTSEGDISIFTLEKGKWQESEFEKYGNSHAFYVKSVADSVKIVQENRVAKWKVNYDQLRQETSFQVYLIGPDQNYIPSTYGNIPIEWKNEYVISWNWEYVQQHFPEPHTQESMTKHLGYLFPDVEFYPFDSQNLYYPAFNLESFSEAARDYLLSEILRREEVATISKTLSLPGIERTYLTGDVMVTLSQPQNYDQFVAEAEALGFSIKSKMMGSYQMSFEGNRIDQDMIDQLILLHQSENVATAYPDMYLEAFYDSKESSPLEMMMQEKE
ncbi:hypothetical protein [Halocola ammonii]